LCAKAEWENKVVNVIENGSRLYLDGVLIFNLTDGFAHKQHIARINVLTSNITFLIFAVLEL